MIDVLLEYCDLLEIAALRHVGRENEKMIKHTWSTEKDFLAWARFENARNEANIFIRPQPDTPHPWLFLDDLSFAKADALSEKYQCLIVETSPDNFQSRLLANRNLDLRERFEVQRVLTHEVGGDVGSTAGCKFGRIPGFKNRKPGKDFWTSLSALPDINLPKFNTAPILEALPPAGGCAPAPASGTYIGTSQSQSESDFGFVIGRLRYFKVSGLDYIAESRRLEVALAESSRSRKHNPTDYARRTISAALSRL